MVGRVELTNKIVSRNLKIEEAKVASVMDFFYKELGEEFQSCEKPLIYIKGLGTMGISLNVVEKRLRRLKWSMEIHKKSTLSPNWSRKNSLEGIRKEMFYLFEVRRRVKKQRALTSGKNLYDSERKLVSSHGKE